MPEYIVSMQSRLKLQTCKLHRPVTAFKTLFSSIVTLFTGENHGKDDGDMITEIPDDGEYAGELSQGQ